MASGRDIVLKIGTDIQDAISGFRKVREESEETQRTVTRNVDSTVSHIQRLASRIRASSVGQGLGAAGGVLGAGGSLGEALSAGLGAAVPEAGVGLGIYEGVLGAFARFSGEQARLNAAQAAIGGANPAAEAASLTRAARAAGSNLEAFKGITTGFTPFWQKRAHARNQALKQSLRGYSAAELALLAPLFPDEFQDTVQQALTEALQREHGAAASASWRQALKGQGQPVSVQNIYSAFDGLGGRNSVGRDVRSVLDARDRNNGRYQPSSRR